MEDYELVGSLGPCKKRGLVLGPGVTLDGGGHTIRGSRTKSSAGVMLNENSNGSRLKNVIITGFERGVRLAGVSGARVEGIESHGNGDPVAHKGYGIDVARAASNNVIENVHVHHNADEGIHIGHEARNNRVLSSRVENNYRENVYFLENFGNSLEGSTLRGGGASSVFVKHAQDVRIIGNQIEERGIQVRGESRNVLIKDNQLTGSGVTVQPYSKGPRGKTVPRDITLSGGTIKAEAACLRLLEASNVRLEAAGLDCRRSIQLQAGSDATAIDTELPRVDCRGMGLARRENGMKVRFVNGEGEAVGGVRVIDSDGKTLGTAGPDGRWEGRVLVETIRCPGPTRVPGRVLTLASGSERQTIEPEALNGDVAIAAP